MVDFMVLTLVPLLIGAVAAVACALPGNFLLLRRQALIGDAISHVVLPGIVVAFLLTGQISTWPMMIGAGAAALVSVVLIEIIRRLGQIETGAAMGVVFTTMFALGVLLLEQTDTSGVHIDVEHALYGNLESLIWLDATGFDSLWDKEALAGLPPELHRITGTSLFVMTCILLLWRPLKIATFDEEFAKIQGVRPALVSFILVTLATTAAVAAFDAVGSIIVIAMFICPPATARLITNDLKTQVVYSVVVAIAAAVIGYVFAGYGPIWLGWPNSVSASGMIATVSGVMLGLAATFGRHRMGSQTALR